MQVAHRIDARVPGRGTNTPSRYLVPFALAVLLASCGTSDQTGGAGALTDRSAYPAGPYGVTAGTILENLVFSNPDGTPFSLDEDVFKDPHNRVLLVYTTAGWCTACIGSQPKLRALFEELHGKGLTILSAFVRDAEYQPATGQQAADWKERYHLPFPVVTDGDFVLGAYYDETQTPLMMVVDVDNMEIRLVTTGFDEQLIRSVIEANLDS